MSIPARRRGADYRPSPLGLDYGAFGYLFIRNAERLSLRYALDRA
jgi:hypothetical protein